ncbi:MAG: hypothetical protein J2P43_05320 [Candidatus Dormibacteraeota bacterium]|nr:hypothetical protein [Candidatus Dormibacteraeota bacterium]MBO0744418.1 hypothetical protein [Candidatus Dormibacteraeota bacterium]
MAKEPYPDLKFDYGAANAAITQLQAVIRLLTTQTNNRVTKANTIGPPNWTGTYSDQFYQGELPRMKSQAAALVTELQRMITTIDNAAQNAQWYQMKNELAKGNKILAPGLPGETPPSGGVTV